MTNSVSILTLPVELVQTLARCLTPLEQRNLRLTCRFLCVALHPIFFAILSINLRREPLEQSLSQLEDLANRKTPYSEFTRTLKIEHILPDFITTAPPPLPEPVERAKLVLEKALSSALTGLRDIYSVYWTTTSGDPSWTFTAIIDALLGFRSTLSNLHLTLNHLITDLEWMRSTEDRTSALKPLALLLQNLDNLTSLGLALTPEIDTTPIFAVLRTPLREISVTSVSSALLDYLAQHPGVLQRLEISGLTNDTQDLAAVFFQQVLPLHAPSLTYFRCTPPDEGAWSFSPITANAISQLTQLKTLHVSVNSTTFDKDLPLLLQTISLFPVLRKMLIEVALVDIFGGESGCGHGWIGYMIGIAQKMRQLILAFRTDDYSSVELRNPWYCEWYRLVRDIEPKEASTGWQFQEFEHPDPECRRLKEQHADDSDNW
ncbi:MYND-type domain-containing protein [Mycena indigotica]|uniref:MYND-type domain-containing protein n=1 Tax=Mycena indigotica TaxID=2126181 RepID=A0A8H6T1S6_9AGAR|nr:MYND-type domain-containing protein [Mycena indigotica]KAF7309334.1 MYND-type domain-containing protein [Mycena indigotica]